MTWGWKIAFRHIQKGTRWYSVFLYPSQPVPTPVRKERDDEEGDGVHMKTATHKLMKKDSKNNKRVLNLVCEIVEGGNVVMKSPNGNGIKVVITSSLSSSVLVVPFLVDCSRIVISFFYRRELFFSV